MEPSTDSKKLRTIAVEEHYVTQAFLDGPGRRLKEMSQSGRSNPHIAAGFARIVSQLGDLGDERIAEMDGAGVEMQVLSLNPSGVQPLEADEAVNLARDANDRLAEAVKRYPTRLAGFAAIPTAAPDKAVEELERTVKEYHFKGTLIHGHTRGRYLDDKFFWPIFESAEKLGVPIYLHPTPPPQSIVDSYYHGNYSPEVSRAFSSMAWGWHIETAIHALRIILSGVFDVYPKLQLVLGHLGETLPFMQSRLDEGLNKQLTKLNRMPSDYLRENVYYTLGSFNYAAPFFDLLLQVGADRIMFSTDYPYGSMAEARKFFDRLAVSPSDKERIAHGNAERLLGL